MVSSHVERRVWIREEYSDRWGESQARELFRGYRKAIFSRCGYAGNRLLELGEAPFEYLPARLSFVRPRKCEPNCIERERAHHRQFHCYFEFSRMFSEFFLLISDKKSAGGGI